MGPRKIVILADIWHIEQKSLDGDVATTRPEGMAKDLAMLRFRRPSFLRCPDFQSANDFIFDVSHD